MTDGPGGTDGFFEDDPVVSAWDVELPADKLDLTADQQALIGLLSLGIDRDRLPDLTSFTPEEITAGLEVIFSKLGVRMIRKADQVAAALRAFDVLHPKVEDEARPPYVIPSPVITQGEGHKSAPVPLRELLDTSQREFAALLYLDDQNLAAALQISPKALDHKKRVLREYAGVKTTRSLVVAVVEEGLMHTGDLSSQSTECIDNDELHVIRQLIVQSGSFGRNQASIDIYVESLVQRVGARSQRELLAMLTRDGRLSYDDVALKN